MFSFQGELQLTTLTVCNPTPASSINPTAIRESNNWEKRLLGKNSVCQRYLHQPLDPGSHSFQLPVLSQHLPNRQDEAHRVCYERMVMVCYIALLFWKPLWFTVLTSDSCDAASSSRYLPSSSSQSSDHYTRFDSFPPRRDNDFAASFNLSWI